MENRLRQIAGDFLKRDEALCFIGYEESPLGQATRPLFCRRPDQLSRLVWNERCQANLASYLPRFREQKDRVVGLAVKGCDARAVRELVRSHQIERSQLFLVGLPCQGVVGADGSFPAARCAGCLYPEDMDYDAVLGPLKSPGLDPRPCQPDLGAMTVEERRAFFEAELKKCIRCQACRRICYGCFCPVCIFESDQPRWLARSETLGDKLFFHAVRAYHLAGRCIGCNECQRACPAGVRLDLFNQLAEAALAELFGFPGAGVREEEPPLVTFSADDPDPFVRRGQ